ncbi:MAG: hypothetical protein V1824_02165 [archaeon]
MSLLVTLLSIIGLVCAIWVIYDVFTINKKLSIEGKIFWTVLAIVLSIITAVVYSLIYKHNLIIITKKSSTSSVSSTKN